MKSNQFFKVLKLGGRISEKKLRYFKYENKKNTNLGEMYLLRKIHKRIYDVPGRPVMSSWDLYRKGF